MKTLILMFLMVASAAASAGYPAPTPAEQQAAFPDMDGMSMQEHMGSLRFGKFLLDRFEWQDAATGAPLRWNARAWWGGDVDRAGFSSEGERHGGDSGDVQTRLFWSHAVSPWWDGTLGLRRDSGEGPDRDWIALGVQGMAPYFFDVDATALVGGAGRTGLRLDVEYELLLTNRLILQPRLELNAWGRSDAERGIGSGISDSAAGLRLRYELCREFAPYLGVEWARKYGGTADMAGRAGAPVGEVKAVAGFRLWF